MSRIIMFNGPRGVGKDFIANEIVECDMTPPAAVLSIMWPLKEAAMAGYGVLPMHVRYMEATKDKPLRQHPPAISKLLPDDVADKTPRQVYIDYGTEFRYKHGQSAIARMWLTAAYKYMNVYDLILVPDVRFQDEVDVAVDFFGAHSVTLVRVHREGRGWEGDIGSYCTHTQIMDFTNDGKSPVDNIMAMLF